MALTVRHNFVSTASDNPSDVSAGKVVASNWNDLHSITGSIDVSNLSVSVFDNGTVSSGTATINVSNSLKQKLTVGGAISVALTSFSVAGIYSEVELQLVNGGLGVTWPTVNWLIGDGTTSTTFSAMGVALQSAGTNWVIIWSTDGGITVYGRAG